MLGLKVLKLLVTHEISINKIHWKISSYITQHMHSHTVTYTAVYLCTYIYYMGTFTVVYTV